MLDFKNYRSFILKNKKYSSFKKTFIIAEIGTNHNNNFNTCRKLIILSKRAGCDAVKFQLFRANFLVQKSNPAYNVLKKYELPLNWLPKISKICKEQNIFFACSPFYMDAIKILKSNGCQLLKIASPEIKNIPLVKSAIKSKLPLIISTGDTNFRDVSRVFKLIPKKSYNKTAFLHCVSEYPNSIKNINLNMINFLKKKFNKVSIGFSDHSMGTDMALAAVAGGASIIEKHITLSKKFVGPDHFFALESKELYELVKKIRNFENAFGLYEKRRLKDENTIYVSLVAKNNLSKNTKIKLNDIVCKRTLKKGIETHNIKKILKKKVKIDIKEDAMFDYKKLK